MFKLIALEGECTNEIVKIEDLPISDAQILSIGKGESTGIVLMIGEKSYYLTSNATDIETTIEKINDIADNLSDALSKIANVLTSIGSGMTGPTTAPPPTLATDVAAINGYVSEIDAAKSDLETLKGDLK